MRSKRSILQVKKRRIVGTVGLFLKGGGVRNRVLVSIRLTHHRFHQTIIVFEKHRVFHWRTKNSHYIPFKINYTDVPFVLAHFPGKYKQSITFFSCNKQLLLFLSWRRKIECESMRVNLLVII